MVRKSSRTRRLEVGRLDEYFQTLESISGLRQQAPRRGWVKAMRDALGMSAAQLANRLSVSRAAVYQLDERESSRAVSLKQLDKAADALECDVFYTFIPRSTVEQTIRAQAKKNAETKLYNANLSMGLEAEGVRESKLVTAVSSSSSFTEALTDRYLWKE